MKAHACKGHAYMHFMDERKKARAERCEKSGYLVCKYKMCLKVGEQNPSIGTVSMTEEVKKRRISLLSRRMSIATEGKYPQKTARATGIISSTLQMIKMQLSLKICPQC